MSTKRITTRLLTVLTLGLTSTAALATTADDATMSRTEQRRQALMSEVTLPMASAPQAQEPTFLKSKTGEAVVVSGSTVKTLESGKTLLQLRGEGPFGVETAECALGKKNFTMCAVTLARAIKKTKTNKDGKKTTYTIYERKLVIQDSSGRSTEIASGKDLNSGKGSYTIAQHGAYVHSMSGSFAFFTERIPKAVKTKEGTTVRYEVRQRMWARGKIMDFKVGYASLASRNSGQGRSNPDLQFVENGRDLCMAYATSPGHGKIAYGCLRGGGWQAIADAAMYDFRLVKPADGWTYLFYYSHRSDSAEVVAKGPGQSDWGPVSGADELHDGPAALPSAEAIDTPESGWQLEADAHGKSAYAVYYFFRNSYHKGLRVAELQGGKLTQAPYTVVREKLFNTGWHPRLTITGSGTLWLTYWDHVLEERRVWTKLKSPGDLTTHKLAEPKKWERRHKKAFVQAGVGAWYTMWNLVDISPPEEDINGTTIGSTEYSLSNTTLLVSSVEAKWGNVNVGMSYAKSIVNEAKDTAQERLATGNEVVDDNIGRLMGSVKVEKLFPGYDVKAQFAWGRYKGTATPGEGVQSGSGGSTDSSLLSEFDEFDEFGDESVLPQSSGGGSALAIDTNYIDMQALFLNKWRLKTGLGYTKYTLPMALHTFYANAGETEYSYGGSYFRNVQVDSIRLIVGHSSLDYVAKYENYFNDLFVDTTVDAGAAFLKFEDPIVFGSEDIDSAITLDARLNVTFGYLLFKRWYLLRGYGLYVRPSYVAEASFLGIPRKPSDRKEDKADEFDSYVSPGMFSVRHGPWLDFGMVF